MAAEKSYAMLGFFVVVSVIVMLATGLFFIQRMRSREVIAMVTYSDENVSGLDVSSPVRLRGVPVGRVTDIRADPRGRTIEIDFEVFTDRLTTIGLDAAQLRERAELRLFRSSQLRTQVVRNPVTGEAYLFIDALENPPPEPELGFTPDRPYIPSMPTPLATLQDRLPEVLERAQETLQTLREIVARVPESMERTDRFFTNVETILRESQLPELSADLRAFSTSSTAQIAQITSQIAQITSNMDGLAGTNGTLMKFAEEARSAIRAADVPASTQAARDAADRTSLAADDLRRSLPAIRDALAQLRELARRLDEQPESVVYGPRPPEAKSR
jgi:paraquat-inducible protein B